MKKYDVGIIGGGPAAMASAIVIKNLCPKADVAIFEKNSVLGKKLAQTGNGACNITNENCETYKNTKAFFRSLGMIFLLENSWAYPHSKEGKSVVNTLEKALKNRGVDIFLNCPVSEIEHNEMEKCFMLTKPDIVCKHLIIAAGGKAAPQFGTTGDSYILAKSLGHRITSLAPCLTNLKGEYLHGISKRLTGVRQEAEISLFFQDNLIKKETGQIQFTAEGISGICVFNLTPYITLADNKKFNDYIVKINLIKDCKDEIYNLMNELSCNDISELKTLLSTVVKSKLAHYIVDYAYDICKNDSSVNLKDKLLSILSAGEFFVTGSGGWKEAQVTRGGVSSDEIKEETCESGLIHNLYIIGEALEYAGPCGGYNLENAWQTGIKAGKHIGEILQGDYEI